MKRITASQPVSAPLGSVQPHAPLLKVPHEGQLLYKVMTIENLLRSVGSNYLHFNRVDRYADLSSSDLYADPNDGRQLPKDQLTNSRVRFEKAPDFTVADYYDKTRARTYACCFSLENSDYIWEHYGNDSEKGKVCVVFEFGKLRTTINEKLRLGNAALEYNGIRCHQIFSVNYGIIEYVDWDAHEANTKRLPNPIIYTYLKDKNKFSEEKEFRISLSAVGMGKFVLNDGSTLIFPPSLHISFIFKLAIRGGTILQMLCAPNADINFLRAELNKLRIRVNIM
ncbi:MAG: DUF2971 domain-containing protein [Candidatus Brocadiaceae bacterium]|nr:DUF2971 domain-containing protein [Candidatus Brocadiaceae bacterium]